MAVVVVLALGHLLGYRLNLPHRVAGPPDSASATEVALTYLEAYDQRDFGLARTLYPDHDVYSRVRPMGRYDDVQPTGLLAEDQEGKVAPAASEDDLTLVWVLVRYTASGFADSDLAVPDGPGGTGFKLSRDDDRHPWRIVDSGSP